MLVDVTGLEQPGRDLAIGQPLLLVQQLGGRHRTFRSFLERWTSLASGMGYAAEGGHPVAQWKLGRMYADGDGVIQDDVRAFEYFSRIANAHAEDSPSAPQAAIVANAYVALGRYYLNGIPNSKIKADTERAREMFSYAASYFGNADAQYDLARLYLKTPDASRDDFRYGARWLGLAAQKGQHQAQAMLGQMLFNGDRLPRAGRPRADVADLGAGQGGCGRNLDQGKLRPGDRQGVRGRPRHGAADAQGLGAGQEELSVLALRFNATF